jgi:hypothetical protein
MFCLLCHEKISRLRAWRTKSEFCCDDHADIYKRQTLERLLTDHQDINPAEAPPLPVDNSRSSGDAEEKVPASETLARFAEEDAKTSIEQSFEPAGEPELDGGSRDEGLQELWRLAEEVSPAPAEGDDDWGDATARLFDTSSESRPDAGLGGLGGGLGSSLGSLGKGLGSGSGTIKEQTPEEALAALRELSGGPRRSTAKLDDSSDELDTLLSAREFDATPQQELGLSAVDENLPASLDEVLSGEESLPPLDAGSLQPLEDDELPSILERLTEHASEDDELEPEPVPVAQELAAQELVEELQSAALPEEEVRAELQEPAALVETQQDEPSPTFEEVSAAEAGSEDLGALDVLAEAVESHLEESEEPFTQRPSSHKVVPFPLSRPKTSSRNDSEETRPAASHPPAAAEDERARPAKLGKGAKAAKGMPGDLSRLHLRPVAVMFGLAPSLSEPGEGAAGWPAAVLGTLGQDGVIEPPLYYPDSGGGRRPGAHLPIHTRLCPLLPEAPEPPSLQGEVGHTNWPDYTLPCESPLPLALGRNGNSARPSVGSERAWMVRIEPALAEGPEFALDLPNGKRHSPWQAPQLPPALVAGVTRQNGSGKLDLSGSQGKFEPSVDRLCLVFPQLGELGGGGIPRQSSSKAPGEELGRWVPPTVLDPRFEIERPAGRDLSDFG